MGCLSSAITDTGEGLQVSFLESANMVAKLSGGIGGFAEQMMIWTDAGRPQTFDSETIAHLILTPGIRDSNSVTEKSPVLWC